MPHLTLGEAAKSTGKTKPTILNAIKKGRISANKNDKGQWEIDPAELHRVYTPVSSNGLNEDKTLRYETPSNTNENSPLQREVDLLREQITDLKEDRDLWRKESEDWKRQANALLTDQRARSPQKPVGTFRARLGHWIAGEG